MVPHESHVRNDHADWRRAQWAAARHRIGQARFPSGNLRETTGHAARPRQRGAVHQPGAIHARNPCAFGGWVVERDAEDHPSDEGPHDAFDDLRTYISALWEG